MAKKIIVNWYLAEKIVVNWELGTTTSTLQYGRKTINVLFEAFIKEKTLSLCVNGYEKQRPRKTLWDIRKLTDI